MKAERQQPPTSSGQFPRSCQIPRDPNIIETPEHGRFPFIRHVSNGQNVSFKEPCSQLPEKGLQLQKPHSGLTRFPETKVDQFTAGFHPNRSPLLKGKWLGNPTHEPRTMIQELTRGGFPHLFMARGLSLSFDCDSTVVGTPPMPSLNWAVRFQIPC